jgi:hypothetical protein
MTITDKEEILFINRINRISSAAAHTLLAVQD